MAIENRRNKSIITEKHSIDDFLLGVSSHPNSNPHNNCSHSCLFKYLANWNCSSQKGQCLFTQCVYSYDRDVRFRSATAARVNYYVAFRVASYTLSEVCLRMVLQNFHESASLVQVILYARYAHRNGLRSIVMSAFKARLQSQ